jgi:glutamate formiminotransferase / 5-formyltetrahydrofolate cyclo-ligase
VLECVPNVAEGRDPAVLGELSHAAGRPLLDVHRDVDHHRSVFTLVGSTHAATEAATRGLASAVAERLDLAGHRGVHPRLGALDVVPFVAVGGDTADAVGAAHRFATWFAARHAVPVFFYGDADEHERSLPEVRRTAFVSRSPDVGPPTPHPRLGATAVGARPPMIAVNCLLDTDDVALARRIAGQLRERDGGLPGVRALGLRLASVSRAQVSMNLVALERTGLQPACEAVRASALAVGQCVTAVELVGLLPAAELERCDLEFREWAQIGEDRTIEARLAARQRGAR